MARYPGLQKSRARRLRGRQTDVENKLWSRLRARQVGGAKFRRQHPLGPFIADFCCVERGLVIELDGGHHTDQVITDAQRSKFIEQSGYRVLRIWNNDVIENLQGVLEKICQELDCPHPNPLPLRGRGDRMADND